jgi:hypothetical protein
MTLDGEGWKFLKRDFGANWKGCNAGLSASGTAGPGHTHAAPLRSPNPLRVSAMRLLPLARIVHQ